MNWPAQAGPDPGPRGLRFFIRVKGAVLKPAPTFCEFNRLAPDSVVSLQSGGWLSHDLPRCHPEALGGVSLRTLSGHLVHGGKAKNTLREKLRRLYPLLISSTAVLLGGSLSPVKMTS